jgi:hypothetical protein
MNLERLLGESINDKYRYRAVFFAGPPGAGKSSVVQHLNNHWSGTRIIDPDKYTEFLARRHGVDLTIARDEPPFKAERRNLRVSAVTHAVNGTLPMFIDGTASSVVRVIARKEILEYFGYDTMMVWIGTDIRHAILNVQSRERRVPLQTILSAYSRLEVNFDAYQRMFSNFAHIENVFLTASEAEELSNLWERERTSSLSGRDLQRLEILEDKYVKSARRGEQVESLKSSVDSFIRNQKLTPAARRWDSMIKRVNGQYLSDVIPIETIEKTVRAGF